MNFSAMKVSDFAGILKSITLRNPFLSKKWQFTFNGEDIRATLEIRFSFSLLTARWCTWSSFSPSYTGKSAGSKVLWIKIASSPCSWLPNGTMTFWPATPIARMARPTCKKVHSNHEKHHRWQATLLVLLLRIGKSLTINGGYSQNGSNLRGSPYHKALRGDYSSQRNLLHLAKHFFLGFLFLLRANKPRTNKKSFRLDTHSRHNADFCSHRAMIKVWEIKVWENS